MFPRVLIFKLIPYCSLSCSLTFSGWAPATSDNSTCLKASALKLLNKIIIKHLKVSLKNSLSLPFLLVLKNMLCWYRMSFVFCDTLIYSKLLKVILECDSVHECATTRIDIFRLANVFWSFTMYSKMNTLYCYTFILPLFIYFLISIK